MTKFFIYALVLASANLFAQSPFVQSEKINWPVEYEPAKSKFYVHNEVEVSAAPQVVWEILMDAEDWPGWYLGAKNVKLLDENSTQIKADSKFSWQTMGLDFVSTIREFEPYSRLSWESERKSIQGYHAWLIVPTATGCKVITDESQNGWLTFFEKTFQPKKLKRLHDVWLAELKKKAESSTNNPSKFNR
jgi:uncharacterized protein YndB with AHSA1/START domain